MSRPARSDPNPPSYSATVAGERVRFEGCDPTKFDAATRGRVAQAIASDVAARNAKRNPPPSPRDDDEVPVLLDVHPTQAGELGLDAEAPAVVYSKPGAEWLKDTSRAVRVGYTRTDPQVMQKLDEAPDLRQAQPKTDEDVAKEKAVAEQRAQEEKLFPGLGSWRETLPQKRNKAWEVYLEMKPKTQKMLPGMLFTDCVELKEWVSVLFKMVTGVTGAINQIIAVIKEVGTETERHTEELAKLQKVVTILAQERDWAKFQEEEIKKRAEEDKKKAQETQDAEETQREEID